MKANLEFNLPEDNEEFYYANNGSNYYYVCHELDQHLRSQLKHGSLTEEQDLVYQEIRDKLRELLEENNVKL